MSSASQQQQEKQQQKQQQKQQKQQQTQQTQQTQEKPPQQQQTQQQQTQQTQQEKQQTQDKPPQPPQPPQQKQKQQQQQVKQPVEEMSEEELMREIREEIAREEAELERQKLEMMANGTFNHQSQNDTIKGQQLTNFQEAIVTTGSEVSIVLLILLALLFIIQAIRKAYNHITTQKQLEKVESVLDKGVPVKAEFFNVAELDPRSYPIYDTEFVDREEYRKSIETNAPITTLKEILLKRAVACIERFHTIQRDGQGIRKNWSMDMLPRDVWDDFNAAQVSMQEEIEDVVKENAEKKFQWGKYGEDIFARAKEVFGEQVNRKKMEFAQKMRQQGMPGQMPVESMLNGPSPRANISNGPPPQAPTSKDFGRGIEPGFLNRRKSKKQAQQQTDGAAPPPESTEKTIRRKKGKHRFPRK